MLTHCVCRGSTEEAPEAEVEAPPFVAAGGRQGPGLATYSGFLRKYTDMVGGHRQAQP